MGAYSRTTVVGHVLPMSSKSANALGAKGQREEEREAKEEWRHTFEEESGWVSTGMIQGGPTVTGADVPIGTEGSKFNYT